MENPAIDTLVVVWSSSDPEIALNMVFMYCQNSMREGWWRTVRIVVWGPSAKLLAADAQVQAAFAEAKAAGVAFQACKACADRYGVSAQLEKPWVPGALYGRPLDGLPQKRRYCDDVLTDGRFSPGSWPGHGIGRPFL